MKSLVCALLCATIGVAQPSTHSFSFDGHERQYIVFLPHNYASLANIPVVLILHGYGGTAQYMMDYTGMNAVADTAGFIAVYPQSEGDGWNSGISDDPNFPTPNVDDVGFMSALIDTLLANYRIDLRRVYVCGHSNGGFMSFKLACQLSSRFAAAASVAGAVANSTAASCAPVTAIPLLVIHGTADPLVLYDGNPYFLSVPQAIGRWLAFNQCTGQPDSVFLPDRDSTDGCTVERISYNHCSGNSRMVFYKVINGGHGWPGATVTFLGNQNRDINAGVEIWNFVKDFTLTPVGTIFAQPLAMNFGTVEPGHSTDSVSLTVSNRGSAPLTVAAISHSRPEFSLVNLPPTPATLPTSGSIRMKAVFRPTGEGVVEDTIAIESSDPVNQHLEVFVRGKGSGTIVAAQTNTLYATSSATPEGSLYVLNTETGDASAIGTLGIEALHSLTVHPSSQQIYGISRTLMKTTLYKVNAWSGEAASVKSIPIADLSAIAFNSAGVLFGGTATGSLYRINPDSGSAALIGTSPNVGYAGLAFSPRTNKLWASAYWFSNDSVYTVDVTTGAAGVIGSTGLGIRSSSLAFSPAGGLYGLTGIPFNFLISIDTVTAAGVQIGSTELSNFRAIVMSPLSVGIGKAPESRIPSSFSLSQSYPNPFNPSTTIRYGLPRKSQVSLMVYSALGQLVSQLVQGEQEAGFHEIRFDGSGLSTGVYFYRLQSGDYVQTKKLLLLR